MFFFRFHCLALYLTRVFMVCCSERIREFFEEADNRVLVFSGDGGVASLSLPQKLPKNTKAVMFLKRTADSVKNATDLDSKILVSDVSAEPLEHLEKLVGEVYLPLLSNPGKLLCMLPFLA